MDRIEPRIERLLTAHADLVARVAAEPDSPAVEAWKARVLEYERSLESIKATGKEFVPGAVGVNIDVPVSGFVLQANDPGA